MNYLMKNKENLIYYIFLFICSTIVAILALNLWDANLTVPFNFSQDGIGWSVIIKNYIEGGNISDFKYYGAPFNNTWEYMPEFSLLLNIILKVLSFFIDKFGIISNGIFLLSFGCIACMAAYCFRKCQLSPQIAFTLSLLYSNLPYHYYRSTQHLNLSFYIFVPLVCYITFLMINDQFYENGKLKISLVIKCSILYLLLGLSDLYYSFFGIMVFGIAWLLNFIKGKKINRIVPFLCSAFSCILGIFLCMIMWWVNIGHISTIQSLDNRSIYDLEIYGLKLSSLILPVKGHILQFLSKVTDEYLNNTPFNEEGAFATLGIIGAIGLVISILSLVCKNEKFNKIKKCGLLNIFIFLVAVNGGVNILIALFITSSIRCYNRLSIYIAFFSFLAIGFWVENISQKLKKGIYYFLLIGITALGVIDQISLELVPSYEENRLKYDEAAETGQHLNELCKEEDSIFFLPFQSSNNYNAINGHDRYESYLPSLFTNKLNWSLYYGENSRNLWAENIASKNVKELIIDLYANDFSAVVIDRYLCEDTYFDTVLNGFIEQLGDAEFISTNQRYYVFSLKESEDSIESKYSADELNKIKKESYIAVQFSDGFYETEMNETDSWNWSLNNSELEIVNLSDEDIHVSFSAEIYSLNEQENLILVSTENSDLERLFINTEIKTLNFELDIKPGCNTISFNYAGNNINVENDSRSLGFCLKNVSVDIVE